jgi:hypothetical protein
MINIYMEMHSESYCIMILNKNVFFSKIETRKVKQALPGDWYQWEGGGYKERVLDGEYGGILCTQRPPETTPGMGRGRLKKNGGGEFNCDIL